MEISDREREKKEERKRQGWGRGKEVARMRRREGEWKEKRNPYKFCYLRAEGLSSTFASKLHEVLKQCIFPAYPRDFQQQRGAGPRKQ